MLQKLYTLKKTYILYFYNIQILINYNQVYLTEYFHTKIK